MAIALAILLAQAGCTAQKTATQATTAAPKAQSWAEKLGYPPGKIVLILHADDVGMCPEANAAAARQLLNDEIQSAAVMMPCPNAAEFIEWAKAHPQEDVGLHLTLTSEWKTYRWPPLSKPEEVPGLIDPDGMMWHTVFQVVMNASPEEVEKEIRAQIEKSLALGYRPSHIDTHMGTLYGSSKFTAVYLKVAEEYQIPAMVIDMRDPAVVAGFKAKGYPINEEMIELVNNYRLPKLDYFASTLNGSTYEEKRANFFKVVDELPPGLSEIIFHPSELTDNLKTITNSWQQRAWEAELFADPKVQQYLRQKGVIFTSWKEIMQRFRAR
ncbi:MAG: ChbG/HpnK family deacetylase [Bacteroidetes bacterium]|nr:MAG: ChbG/HpnK family deacetylase [Bacteroidota bacterium]